MRRSFWTEPIWKSLIAHKPYLKSFSLLFGYFFFCVLPWSHVQLLPVLVIMDKARGFVAEGLFPSKGHCLVPPGAASLPLGRMKQRNCSSTKYSIAASICTSLPISFSSQEITVTRRRPSSSRWECTFHPKYDFWSSSILGGCLCLSKSLRTVVIAERTWRFAFLHAEGV